MTIKTVSYLVGVIYAPVITKVPVQLAY